MATSLDPHRVQRIALGLALAAFVAVTIALIVVATRGGATGDAGRLTLGERQVSVDDLGQIENSASFGSSGFVVTDTAMATRLGLGSDERIIDMSGTPVHSSFGYHEVLEFARIGGATALYVTIETHDARRTMRWTFDRPLTRGTRLSDLDSKSPSVPYVPMPSTPVSPSVDPSDPLADQLNQIAHSDDTHYTVPRSLVGAVLNNPMAVAKGARIVPNVKDGKPNGFKLYAIRPTSVFALIGFKNGDTIVAINGFEMTSADKALEVYTKLKDATALSVDIVRRGKPETIEIKVQ